MIDNRWQMVTCAECGSHYRCTPLHDYYNATTNSDGLCDACLLAAAGLGPVPSPPTCGVRHSKGET